MVAEDGQVKVLDFGIAKLVEAPAGDVGAAVATRTSTSSGRFVGTGPTCPPSRFRASSSTPGPMSSRSASCCIRWPPATSRSARTPGRISWRAFSVARRAGHRRRRIAAVARPRGAACLEKDSGPAVPVGVDVRNDLDEIRTEPTPAPGEDRPVAHAPPPGGRAALLAAAAAASSPSSCSRGSVRAARDGSASRRPRRRSVPLVLPLENLMGDASQASLVEGVHARSSPSSRGSAP